MDSSKGKSGEREGGKDVDLRVRLAAVAVLLGSELVGGQHADGGDVVAEGALAAVVLGLRVDLVVALRRPGVALALVAIVAARPCASFARRGYGYVLLTVQ